jgi:hypothetical protein
MTTLSADLYRTLPGTWRILATTFPLWLSGKRLRPTITYTPLSGDPLVLRDDVSYHTRAGVRRHLIGIDRYRPSTGRFTWRGCGLLGLLTSRWTVDHVSSDGELAVLTFSASLATPAGMDVLGRGGEARPGIGERLAPGELGLTAEKFAALTWL